MERIEMIDAVGRKYHTSNIENGEFSYPKAFKEKNLDFEPIISTRSSKGTRMTRTSNVGSSISSSARYICMMIGSPWF